jgi:hypothetical protein
MGILQHGERRMHRGDSHVRPHQDIHHLLALQYGNGLGDAGQQDSRSVQAGVVLESGSSIRSSIPRTAQRRRHWLSLTMPMKTCLPSLQVNRS